MTALCECGCGQPAPIARDSWAARGIVGGEPQRYIYGHYRPQVGDPRYRRHDYLAYDEEDRGYISPCWIFHGKPSSEGYTSFWRDGKSVLAHRAFYEHYIGTIETGAHLDHLCRVRNCVNPMHLDPVTRRENILRGVGPSARNAAKTHCIHGHEFTPENTYTYVTTAGGLGRSCRECARERGRRTRKVGRVRDRLRAAVIARDGYTCGICGGAVESGDVHIDHVVPKRHGGPTELGNLQVAHSQCNLRKRDSVGDCWAALGVAITAAETEGT
jgi:5-methylcytosine-specific restriction endonuclease McrA